MADARIVPRLLPARPGQPKSQLFEVELRFNGGPWKRLSEGETTFTSDDAARTWIANAGHQAMD